MFNVYNVYLHLYLYVYVLIIIINITERIIEVIRKYIMEKRVDYIVDTLIVISVVVYNYYFIE